MNGNIHICYCSGIFSHKTKVKIVGFKDLFVINLEEHSLMDF